MSAGWRLDIVEEIGSTSDALIERAKNGEPGGIALLARRQTRGRGRHGRTWEGEGGNLALSLLLRDTPAEHLPGLVLAAGLSLQAALQPHVTDGRTLRLKWPNDVMLDGGKLGGILVESAIENGRAASVVAGFGANLRTAPTIPGRRTACLADCARTVPPPEDVAAALLHAWDGWTRTLARDVGPLRTAWLRAAHPIGTPLVADGTEGIFAGLAEDGALLLDTPGGTLRIRTGEVQLGAPVGERPRGPHMNAI